MKQQGDSKEARPSHSNETVGRPDLQTVFVLRTLIAVFLNPCELYFKSLSFEVSQHSMMNPHVIWLYILVNNKSDLSIQGSFCSSRVQKKKTNIHLYMKLTYSFVFLHSNKIKEINSVTFFFPSLSSPFLAEPRPSKSL